MERSTLVQLDSIDSVSPQRLRCTTGFRAAPTLISISVVCAMVWILLCLSMLGRPLPMMIFETFWLIEKDKNEDRCTDQARKFDSTLYGCQATLRTMDEAFR